MIDFPLVTVNILTFNRKNEVIVTLKKILNIDYPEGKLEIILVDNASTDGTSDYIKENFPNIKVITLPKNIGISGWNEGFKAGSGKYFLVLDDDCHIEGDTLKNSIIFLEKNKDFGILSFNVIDPITKYSFTQYFPYGIFSFWGCAVLIKRDVIEKTGGFDSNIFLYAHEAEFVFNAMKYGFKHKVMISNYAYHRKNPKEAINKGINNNIYFSELYTYFKHLNGKRLYLFFIGAFIERIYKDFKSILKFNFDLTLMKIFFNAFILGEKFKTIRNTSIENLFFYNDIRIREKSISFFLLKRFSKFAFSRKKFFFKFIKKRIVYYPDFDSSLFLKFKPVSERKTYV